MSLIQSDVNTIWLDKTKLQQFETFEKMAKAIGCATKEQFDVIHRFRDAAIANCERFCKVAEKYNMSAEVVNKIVIDYANLEWEEKRTIGGFLFF